jgi:hypothetical protein
MWTIGHEPPSSMIAHKSGVKRTAAVRWDAVPFRLFGLVGMVRDSEEWQSAVGILGGPRKGT